MTARPGDLGDAYARAIERYVASPAESELQAAYEIARQAMAAGLGIVDLATAHQRALERLIAKPPPGCDAIDVGKRAAQFLLESLSPFEMTLRGFREAIERLEIAHNHLEERVQQRTAELSAANERLQREVAERERAEMALREAELSYQSLVASIRDYAIFMLDPNGIVATWNPGAQRFKGYLPDEIIGRHFSIFYTREDRENHRPELMLAKAAANGSCGDEGWRVRKDGSRYWADVIVTALRGDDGRLKGFTKVARDVTERRHAQQALEGLNAQLQRANQEKDEFVAMVSHELRNPLAAIVSGVDVLRDLLPADPRAHRTLDIVRRNADMQKRLVNDLLDLSRLRRDRLTLQHAPVALDAVAQAVISGEEAEAARAGLVLALEADPASWVLGDADRLQQVLLNLIGNAMKFTPPGGRIDVKVIRSDRAVTSLGSGQPLSPAGAGGVPPQRAASVCLLVADTGRGIDRALLPRLFQPFQQGDIASERQRGLGLGLALVKLIAEKHRGTVWAESDGPNRGSRVIVALPALVVQQAREGVTPDAPICLLLVEDNADTRELLTIDLESRGYRVVAAESGEQALALLATLRPDLILSDLAMPGMSGYDFLKRARRMDGMRSVPAFAVTASTLEEDLGRARESGFAGHFTKPVDVRALDDAIRTWLTASRKSR